MTGDQLTLGAVLARLEEREREIAAQADAAKERIAELSAPSARAQSAPAVSRRSRENYQQDNGHRE
ncbi:hypothetical protein [Streptomyces sp. NPDC001450]